MEKNPNCEKSSSFSKILRRRNKSTSDVVDNKSDGVQGKGLCDEISNPEESFLESDMNHDQIQEEVDEFIQKLALGQDVSNASPPQIPDCFQTLLGMFESKISIYERREASVKFGQNHEEDVPFFEDVSRVSKIISNLDGFSFDSGTTCYINRAGSVLHRAMLLFENELRAILDNSKHTCNNNNNTNIDSKSTPKSPKPSFFNSTQESIDYDSKTEVEVEEFPYFLPQSIANMNRIATAMISAGYETECCIIYNGCRLKALDVELSKQGFENMNMEDVQRMKSESMEGEIRNWIHIVKHCTVKIFPAERKLCNMVFSEHNFLMLFYDLVTWLTLRLLNFPNALVLIKDYSTEKLFRFLDIYETLRDVIGENGDEWWSWVQLEISVAQYRIGGATVSIFCQLESSIKSDNGRVPMASGAVHPLTRYTMNYLEYACEYKDTLEQVFQQHHKTNINENKTSPFSTKLMMVMELLDDNIDMKSKLYRDPALRYIFLMNNGWYILQKIKGSREFYEMMGHSWSRKRSSELRHYHKNYQRETWSKVLHCINHEGLQINGKVSKAILKEKIKNFNTMLEDILKTQTTWVVTDSQLQSELRVSISAVVIPAYRSFLGRFKSYLDSKNADKYIKYQPEDIEGLIDQLFDGNATSMARKRT